MKSGDRVKYSEQAFERGVCARTERNIERRGTVSHQQNTFPHIWVVKWDGRKTPDRLHPDFLVVVKEQAP